MSVLARNASSRLRVRYALSSVSRTCSISGRIRVSRDCSTAVPSSSAAGPLGHHASLGEQTRRWRRAPRGRIRPSAQASRARWEREASWSADAAASSAARKYAAATGFIAVVPSGRRHLGCLAIWRKARASAGVLYPCCDRRCSRSSGHVVEQLLRRHEKVVEPVDFRRRSWTIGDTPASPRENSRDGRRRARGAARRSRPTRLLLIAHTR